MASNESTSEHALDSPSPDAARWPHTGAIMAGGESRRMGEAKEGVRLWRGRPMIEYAVLTLQQLCRQVVIVGRCVGYEPPPERPIVRIPDVRPGNGPLCGIEALLRSGLDTGYVVVACDQPLLSAELLRRLVAGDPDGAALLRPADGRWLGPFPGYFPAAWLTHVEAVVAAGRHSVRAVAERGPVRWVPISADEERLLRSVDTPQDVAELLGGDEPVNP